MEFRHYGDADYESVCDFLIELNRDSREHIHWNWARFEWMIEHPEFDKSLKGAIGLWRDGERVVGAAIYDMYFGEAFCAALPGYTALYPAILEYAYRELRDDSGLAVALCDDCAEEIAAAKTLGFVPEAQAETVMRRELDADLPVSLPEGYRLTELDPEQEDPKEIQWLFWQGFDHGTDRAAFEADFAETGNPAPKRRAHFDPRLSIAVIGPDEEMAACCCLWFLDRTDYAYVEPVCTVPAHRGKGLGRAMLHEAMNRARALGARRAYVISDQVFYEKLGFEKDRRFPFFRKR